MANRAVLVGISRYSSASGLRELKAPVSDVKRLQECLERNGNFEVIPLIDQPKEKVERETRQLLRKAKPDDKIIFYYSGHGERTFPGNQLLLTTVDYDRNDPEAGAVEKRKVFEWASTGRAGQLVMIFDCCFAAAGISETDGGRSGDLIHPSEFQLNREGGGTHILMSSDEQTRASTGDTQTLDGRASHFTDLLVRGLEGDAAPGLAQITIRDICAFLQDLAPVELSARPVLEVGKSWGNFPLVNVERPERTLIPREVRDGSLSRRPVERIGAIARLARIVAVPISERHRQGALRLLEEIRDSPTSQDDAREAALEALMARELPDPQVVDAKLESLGRELQSAKAEASEALGKLATTEEILQAMRSRQAEADTQSATFVAQLGQRDQLLQERQRALEKIQSQQDALQASLDDASNRLTIATRRAEDAEHIAGSLSSRSPSIDTDIARLRDERDEARQLSERTGQQLKLAESKVKMLEHQSDVLAQRLHELQQQSNALEQSRLLLQRKLDDSERQTTIAELSASALERKAKEIKEENDAQQKRIVTLDTDLLKLRDANAALRNRRDQQDQLIFQQGSQLSRLNTLVLQLQDQAREGVIDRMQIVTLERQAGELRQELEAKGKAITEAEQAATAQAEQLRKSTAMLNKKPAIGQSGRKQSAFNGSAWPYVGWIGLALLITITGIVFFKMRQ